MRSIVIVICFSKKSSVDSKRMVWSCVDRRATTLDGRRECPCGVNDLEIYDPPKWKTLDMIEPGRESVVVVKVESL